MYKPLKILIVDDSRVTRNLYSKYFSYQGFFPVTACDGKVAIEKFKLHKFEIVLTNFIMPNMNGLELVSWIKQNIVPKPMILFYSAFVHDYRLLNAIEAGTDEFYDKIQINCDFPDLIMDMYLDKLSKEKELEF